MTIPFRYFLAAHVPVWCMVVGLGVVWNPPTAPGNVPGVQILAAPSDRIEGLVIPTRKTGEVSGNPGQMAQRICFDYRAGNASTPIPEDGRVCIETLGKDRDSDRCSFESSGRTTHPKIAGFGLSGPANVSAGVTSERDPSFACCQSSLTKTGQSLKYGTDGPLFSGGRALIGSTQGNLHGAVRTLDPLGKGWPPSDFAGSGDTGRSVGVPGPHRSLEFGVVAARKDVRGHLERDGQSADPSPDAYLDAAKDLRQHDLAGIKARPLLQAQDRVGIYRSSGRWRVYAVDLLDEVKLEIILAAADKCGVDPGLAIALGMRESGLVWPEKLHEARGIYQVKDSTARGVSRTLDNRTVWGNAVAGLCYLRQLRDREGSWEAALLSYREGPHRKATSREAHAYVADIMEF